jgi:sigma54-dependent transcription regulator
LSKIEQRRQTVAEMIASHRTYREIGDALGVASSTVSEDVKSIREQWRYRAIADYANLLAEEIAKLDLLERKLLPEVLHGGPEGGVNLRAVDRVLAIRDRRARMLGLDAPSKVEAVRKVELIVKALEATVEELGLDATRVRPVLGRRLRELDAAP